MHVTRFHIVLATIIVFVTANSLCLAQRTDSTKEKSRDTVQYEVPDKHAACDLQLLATKVEYPKDAIKLEFEGKVFVDVLVDSTGGVVKCSIFQSIYPSLDIAAIKAISKVQWTPALLKGKAVNEWITVPISFKLHDDPPHPNEQIRFNMKQLYYHVNTSLPKQPECTVRCTASVLADGTLKTVEISAEPPIDSVSVRKIERAVKKLVFRPRIIDTVPLSTTTTFFLTLPLKD